MKRTITELEQKLIDKGFKLHHKTYVGKHSQFIGSYTYVGVVKIDDKDIFTHLTLNAKRDEILGFTFDSPLSWVSYTLADIDYLKNVGELVSKYIYE